jgi:hypothetical protein
MWGCEGWGGEHIDTETVTSERAAAMVYAATIFEIDGVDPQTAAKWFDVFATADNPIAWRHR